MRILLAIIILAALGWGGYWYWSAKSRESALAGWLEERRAAGWIASADDITINGFPNRIDAIVTGLELADPNSGWAWSADRFEILSLSYKPHHLIAVWPGEQAISTPFETLRLSSNNFRGSLIFEPNTTLALDRATLELDAVTLTGSNGDAGGLKHAILAIRQTEGADPGTYDIAFDASDLRLAKSLTDRFSADGDLPTAIGTVKMDTTVTFDKKWNRETFETDMPEIDALSIAELSATWGELDIRGRGDLEADSSGLADGEIRLRARNWEEMIDMAKRSGAISSSLSGPMKTGLGLIATLSGDSNSLRAPLTFEDGETRLGPIRVGKAPRLHRTPGY